MSTEPVEPPPEIPEASEEPAGKRISAVWIIPLVAALIGGWLVFKNATQEKTVAQIEFRDAAGLEAGKTVVKLRNIKIGKVTHVSYTSDLSRVVVSVELTGIDQERLTDSTRFWVVRPRIGIGGVSGLDTLLSGAYIEMDPGPGGKPTTHFLGLEEPENYQLGNPGTTYVLNARELGSLSRGSPIRYRGIDVGQVTRYRLSQEHDRVEIEIFIRAPHDRFIHEDTRFWDISGIDLELGAKGVRVGLDAVSTLLAGGISFTNRFRTSDSDAQAPANTVFPLYDTETPRFEETRSFSAPLKLYFENGVAGLSVGAPVEFKGLRIGTVRDISAEADASRDGIDTYAIIEIEPDRLPGTQPTDTPDPETRLKDVYAFLDRMVQHGLKGQLKTGNILTGQSLINLDVFPDPAGDRLEYSGDYPVLPTVPETFQGLIDQVDDILRRIDEMPLETIAGNLKEATETLDQLMHSLNPEEGGTLGLQIHETLQELGRASRAIRSTAEYLERHPEALIKGKQGDTHGP